MEQRDRAGEQSGNNPGDRTIILLSRRCHAKHRAKGV